MISIITALDQNNAIGCRGKLLCYLPGDLKHFKEITSGHAVVMGRKTWESLPKKPLPNRHNIVVTTDRHKRFEGAFAMHSIEEVLDYANDVPGEEIFIIGGAALYDRLLPYADKLYITRIRHQFKETDVYFPKIDKDNWKHVSLTMCKKDDKNEYDYDFSVYVRK